MSSCNEMMNNFNYIVCHIINSIAPIETKVINKRPKTPWRTGEIVRMQEKSYRQAKCKWHENILQVYYEIYICKFTSCNTKGKLLRPQNVSKMINKTFGTCSIQLINCLITSDQFSMSSSLKINIRSLLYTSLKKNLQH